MAKHEERDKEQGIAEPRHEAQHRSPRPGRKPQQRCDLQGLARTPAGYRPGQADEQTHEDAREQRIHLGQGNDPKQRRGQIRWIGGERRDHLGEQGGRRPDGMGEEPLPHGMPPSLHIELQPFALQGEHQAPPEHHQVARGQGKRPGCARFVQRMAEWALTPETIATAGGEPLPEQGGVHVLAATQDPLPLPGLR